MDPAHPQFVNRPLRVGLAGAGMVSAHHLRSWSRIPQAAVIAVCDPDRAKAEDRARAFGISAVYDDVRRMLAEQHLDALDIATPPDTHAQIVRFAADAGVHVLCQKPLCTTLSDAEILVQDVGDRIRLMVHENWRFRPYYRQVLSWVRQGCIGGIVQCRLASRSSGLLPVDGAVGPGLIRQPFLATLPRLIIAELLVHHLDVARLLAGPLQVLACRIGRVSPDVVGEDSAIILMEGANRSTVVVEGNMSAPGCPPLPVDAMELIGTAGSVFLHGQTLSLAGTKTESLSYDLADAYEQSYDNAIWSFVDCLLGAKPFETSAVDHLETLRLAEAAYGMAGSLDPCLHTLAGESAVTGGAGDALPGT